MLMIENHIKIIFYLKCNLAALTHSNLFSNIQNMAGTTYYITTKIKHLYANM
jgi:hypothetical protein